jgi:molybdenum cofactor synthesis domain-containing protein
MVERTSETDDGIAVRTSVAPGTNVMAAGADIAAGERALGPGTRLSAREIGLLAALGVDEVPVRGTPTVGIVSTGDELVRPGGDLAHDAGQIYDVNSYTIASAVEAAGGEPRLYPHVGDDMDALESQLGTAASECDLVCSSGSTSASALDVVYRVIEAHGKLHLHGVAVKPGKPTLVGTIGGAAYVGLPGYPVSALSIFRRFVAPALRDAAGLDESPTTTVEGHMAVRERYEEGRHRLMPAGLVADGDGEVLVYAVDKGSGATTSLAVADGVVDVPADTAYLDAGERVTVRLFSPEDRPPTVLGVGEADPLLNRLLDRLERPRYLAVGSREGRRRLANGVPDVAVVAGPQAEDALAAAADGDLAATRLGGWERDWGLVVPADNPDGIDGLAALIDRDLSFVNRGREAGLRGSFDDALEALAAERGTDRIALADAIDGYGLTTKGVESPARRVAAGEADAGLGLRATAAALDMGFVDVGTESVAVLAADSRLEKAGVDELRTVLGQADGVAAGLDGVCVHGE